MGMSVQTPIVETGGGAHAWVVTRGNEARATLRVLCAVQRSPPPDRAHYMPRRPHGHGARRLHRAAAIYAPKRAESHKNVAKITGF